MVYLRQPETEWVGTYTGLNIAAFLTSDIFELDPLGAEASWVRLNRIVMGCRQSPADASALRMRVTLNRATTSGSGSVGNATQSALNVGDTPSVANIEIGNTTLATGTVPLYAWVWDMRFPFDHHFPLRIAPRVPHVGTGPRLVLSMSSIDTAVDLDLVIYFSSVRT